MKIFITGISGFVGSYLSGYLRRRGFEVVGVSSTLLVENDEQDTISYAAFDRLASQGKTKGSVIVHCAGRAHVMHENAQDPEKEYFAINADLTRTVRDIAVKGGASQMIFFSSVKVNGERSLKPFSPEDIPHPEDAYGKSKLAGERCLLDDGVQQCIEKGVCFTVIRLPLVYGKGVKGNLLMLKSALSKYIPLPFGLVQNKRDMVSLANLSSLVLHFVQFRPKSSSVWMVSDGQSLTTSDICRLIASGTGRPAILLPVPKWLLARGFKLIGKPQYIDRLLGDLEVDISKTLSTGWRPELTVQEGFAEMCGAELRAGM
ncbi:MAG: NAD-dependent epimerase/dehydratase family protein [Hahellaceae bacterium]|nr:NAD-dependent epimerase/dehydratase family protein [Hahellaceae bacterium]MCP5211314.1 NAD-dependent epimerase/dehydratase family protein [Hahellaceae bacterium]